MITLTAKIELVSGGNETMSLDKTSLVKNKIATDLGGVIGSLAKSTANPIILGSSKFGRETFQSKVPFFIGNTLCDENGLFESEQSFVVSNANPITAIEMEFDKYWGKHPNTVTIEPRKNVSTEKYSIMEIDGSEVVFYAVVVESDELEEVPYEVLTDEITTEYGARTDYGWTYGGGAYRFAFSFAYNSSILYPPILPIVLRLKGKETTHELKKGYLTVVGLSDCNSVKVIINDWNVAKSPIVIKGVYVDIAIDITPYNSSEITHTLYDRADTKLPSFGIFSNIGSVEFYDNDEKVLSYAEKMMLESGKRCTFQLNETFSGKSEQVGEKVTDKWDYGNDSKIVSVSLKDELEEWQEINVDALEYNPKTNHLRNLRLYYELLYGVTPSKYRMKAFDDLDEATKERLSNYYVRYFILYADTLWNNWQKLCQVAQAHIYTDRNGETVFKYNGGN